MMWVDVQTLVAFLGVFVAVVMRTLLPYVQKVREAAEKGENVPLWSQRYTATCLSALITGFVLSVLVFPTVPMSAQPTSLIYAFFWLSATVGD